MKLALNIIALIGLLVLLFFSWTNGTYDKFAQEINITIHKTITAHQNAAKNAVDFSSQEFRDDLNAKMYGKQNYEDMKDPNMASRIYNSRMNMPTQKQIEQRKKDIRNARIKRLK